MGDRSSFRLGGKALYVASGVVMLLLLVLSMSIRHSVLCESGSVQESDAERSLGKQSFEARLLNVEQEAMENSMLIERVLRLLQKEYAGSKPLEFASLYADAGKLAVEIDAAFDKIDDDIFAKADAKAHEHELDDALPEVVSLRDDDDDDDASSSSRRARHTSRRDDPLPAAKKKGDDDERRPASAFAFEEGESLVGKSGPRDPADNERCAALAKAYNILPQISWGDAPNDVQLEWRALDCDAVPGI